MPFFPFLSLLAMYYFFSLSLSKILTCLLPSLSLFRLVLLKYLTCSSLRSACFLISFGSLDFWAFLNAHICCQSSSSCRDKILIRLIRPQVYYEYIFSTFYNVSVVYAVSNEILVSSWRIFISSVIGDLPSPPPPPLVKKYGNESVTSTNSPFFVYWYLNIFCVDCFILSHVRTTI